MANITRFVEKRLKLRVNREKSRVDRATKRTLGSRGDRNTGLTGSALRGRPTLVVGCASVGAEASP